MWRGALLDRFARLEGAALHCLFALKAEVGEGVNGSCVAWQRFSQLLASLENPKFAAPARKLRNLLDEIEGFHQMRTALAHGVIKQSRAGIDVTWEVRVSGKWEKRRLRLNWLEALDKLVKVDKLARDFSSQTGQIRSLCSKDNQPR